MRSNGWQWVWVVGFVLSCASGGQAQDEPEVISLLDRLPTWRPADPPSAGRRRSARVKSEATRYADLDALVRQNTEGRRVESLVLTGQAVGQNAHKLWPLLPHLRVLTLKELTTGQADSLLRQVGRGARLERLTIDITHLGPDRANPDRMVRLPTALGRFRKLRDVRIQEDGLDWAGSLPVLAGITALRRLDVNRHPILNKNNQQPLLSTLRQITALHLHGDGWQLMPEMLGGLTRLTELEIAHLHIDTATLTAILNRLPALETFRMTKCWRVQTLSFAAFSQLKTVVLAYNDKMVADSAMLAGMTHLEQFTYKGGQPIDLTGLANLTRLRYLNVMGNGQTSRLPERMVNLTRLTDLRLYNLRLGSLLASFGSLRRLQTLHLNQCGLDSLPVTFSRLTALRDVRLSGNKLRRLPAIGSLKNLRQLNVSAAQLTTLPDGIGQLTKLTSLNVSENQLTELPASLLGLVNLKSLQADHNQLVRLPNGLGQLTRLTGLSLHLNQLTQLPASLSQLVHLTSISADYNRLDSLPRDFGKLRNIQFLSLSNNRLTALPANIDQLDSLRYLWIEQNRLRMLPAGVGQLRHLQELRLDGNELNALPTDLSGLQKLTVLSLNKLPIAELPASVGSLTKLQMLSVMDTPLRSLPDSIGALVNLHFVRLTNNELTTLPDGIGRWRNVTTMDLTGNRLEQLPNGIGRMVSLTELILDGRTPGSTAEVGNLRQLPDSIVHCDGLLTLTIRNQPRLDADDAFSKAARLKNLSELSVVNCNITRLPEVTWKEVAWRKLNLTDNQLTELPYGLTAAPELRSVSARGNWLPDGLNRDFHSPQALLSAFAEANKLPLDSTSWPNGKLTEALLRSANEKGSAGDWAGAVSALTKAIVYAPDTLLGQAYGERSSLYYARKQYVNALADLDSAIVHTPQLLRGTVYGPASVRSILGAHWKWKGAIFAEMGQYDAALGSLVQAERLLPTDPFPKYAQSVGSNEIERGRYLILLGKRAAADSSYRRAIDAYGKDLRPPHIGIQLLVVDLCLVTGQYDRAQQLLATSQPTERQKEYDSLKKYLSTCLSILQGGQSGQQAVATLLAYRATNPEKIYRRLSLSDKWLVGSNLSAEKITALRQLNEAAKDWIVQPE